MKTVVDATDVISGDVTAVGRATLAHSDSPTLDILYNRGHIEKKGHFITVCRPKNILM